MDDRSHLRASRRRRLSRAGGLGLVVVSLVGVASGWRGSAGAVEVEERATITRQAYFTHPATEALPPLLLQGFPPSTACLVAGLVGIPQVCGTQIRDLLDTLGLGDGLPVPTTPDAEVLQAVVPGTTPVGMLGGQQRYASLFQFALPILPEGEEFTSVELILHQEGISFALESPAFRQAILAAVLQAQDPDPDVFAQLIDDVASGTTPLVAQIVTGIEACPALQPWNGGDAQNAALDGTRLPDVDCVLGTSGVFDPADQTWTFDVTFAVEAWTEGTPDGRTLPNEGIVLRPVGAPNVAYGDPDLSTNFQISLADGDAPEATAPRLRYSTQAAFTPAAPPAPPAPRPPAGPVSFTPSAPVVAAPTPPAAPAPALGALTARWGDRDIAASRAETSAWVWLLLPLGLAGMLLFGESLLVETVAARTRPGAMSRLMRERGVTDASLRGSP